MFSMRVKFANISMQQNQYSVSYRTMKMTPIKFFTYLLITASVLSGCASLSKYKEAPQLNLVNLQLLESSPFEQRYQIKFRVQNPNTESMSLVGMHFTLEINDKKFMRGLSNQEITIPAFSDALVDATGTTTLLGIARQVQGLQNSNKASFSYTISVSSFSCPSLSIVALTCSEPGVIVNWDMAFKPIFFACLATLAALSISS